MTGTNLDGLTRQIAELQAVQSIGRVETAEGGLVWVTGISHVAGMGDRVRLNIRQGHLVDGEIVRLTTNAVAIMPYGPVDGIGYHDRVTLLGPSTIAPDDSWIGRIIDPYGRPLDNRPLYPGPDPLDFKSEPPPAATRKSLGNRLETGLNVFNTLLPLVRGQRVGIFAGSGVGKSTLIAQMVQHVEADIVVLALVGERGRELNEFVEEKLGVEGMRRTIVVAATSDCSPVERRKCPQSAMTVAEYFRDQGAHVLFLADSITRFAEAHREIAIAAGELPALRGYPASTSHQIMSLCERAGPGTKNSGDITALFSVLVAGSDMDEPIADILRGALDGHVVLDRRIAESGRFPAIDVLRSVSRALPKAATVEEFGILKEVRSLIGIYQDVETMVQTGLYKPGSDPKADSAISAHQEIETFLSGKATDSISGTFIRLSNILRKHGMTARA